MSTPTLREVLNYEPVELRFGTSGRRGEVVHLTQLEVYACALAEIEYLQALPAAEGGIAKGDEFYYACDLRPSSTRFVAEQGGRGELAQAVAAAIADGGMRPVFLGALPTPALTYFALTQGKGSMMVTGSHIPFDRNGYKTNTSKGELLKQHEGPVTAHVGEVRQRLYGQAAAESAFGADGCFKGGPRALAEVAPGARTAYKERYRAYFGRALEGLRLLMYQHSAVGRDLVAEILEELGAEVVRCGRSETFVPIDTENIDAEQLAAIQALVDAEPGRIDAVVSTDGDSDRPLICGVDGERRARFFSGDLVGMVVAEALEADAVVVPISCNDAIDRGALAGRLEPKTKIGSPFVIAGMEAAQAAGKQRVCGWEANGGFLTGSAIGTLRALPTRDAVLPIVCVLAAARKAGARLEELFGRASFRGRRRCGSWRGSRSRR